MWNFYVFIETNLPSQHWHNKLWRGYITSFGCCYFLGHVCFYFARSTSEFWVSFFLLLILLHCSRAQPRVVTPLCSGGWAMAVAGSVSKTINLNFHGPHFQLLTSGRRGPYFVIGLQRMCCYSSLYAWWSSLWYQITYAHMNHRTVHYETSQLKMSSTNALSSPLDSSLLTQGRWQCSTHWSWRNTK